MDTDQELFFKDLGATAEQTVEQVRGIEENRFSALPWMVDLNRKAQSVVEQQLAAGLKFAHRLSDGRDFKGLTRVQTEWPAS